MAMNQTVGDRSEPGRDRRRAAALHAEQPDQDREAQRDDVGLEGGRRELQPFDRRQHRDRRRDDRVAVEQRGAGHAEQRHREDVAPHDALKQRHQRERAALAVVVGAHDQEHVFQRHDDDQRPQHQRHDAEHHLARERAAGGRGGQAFLERVERARADVAVDDADGAERQGPEPGARMGVLRLGGRRGGMGDRHSLDTLLRRRLFRLAERVSSGAWRRPSVRRAGSRSRARSGRRKARTDPARSSAAAARHRRADTAYRRHGPDPTRR